MFDRVAAAFRRGVAHFDLDGAVVHLSDVGLDVVGQVGRVRASSTAGRPRPGVSSMMSASVKLACPVTTDPFASFGPSQTEIRAEPGKWMQGGAGFLQVRLCKLRA